MKKGFTILELLVASLLLGMLVTILTMIFNQSSIAWRTGAAGVANLDRVRDNIAEVREEADNIFIHGDTAYRITGLWDKNGSLRKRACNYGSSEASDKIVLLTDLKGSTKGEDIGLVGVGQGAASKAVKTYTIGVTSLGPNADPNVDYDDITTWPDEIE